MNRTEYNEAVKSRNEKLLEAARSGVSYAKIAAELGLTRARVSQIAKKAGIVRRERKAA